MIGKASKIGEKSINDKIADELRKMHPRWKEPGCVVSENTGVLIPSGKRPDIMVRHPRGIPVVIETEVHPARGVIKDAESRLGQKLANDGILIEKAIALWLPERLRSVDQGELSKEIRRSQFKFLTLSAVGKQDEDESHQRWPAKGWIKGGIEDLATFVEHVAMSENKIEKSLEVLEEAVNQASNILQNSFSSTSNTRKRIASVLYQEESPQTSRIAMAILANAISFHTDIIGHKDVRSIEVLKGTARSLQQEILDEWRRIRNEINYWPIFDIALKILEPIGPETAQKVLEKLTTAVGKIASLGATSQHDLSGRMLQGVISDRKALSMYYTRPNSAALLAEIAISRMKVAWANVEALKDLRIADFACGTGALLNATYGAIMLRNRRGGGAGQRYSLLHDGECSSGY